MTEDARPHGGDAAHGHGPHIPKEPRSQNASYDLITEVVSESWEEALRVLGGPPSDPLPLWTFLVRRILAAVGEGERDPERLKRRALRFLES